MSATATESNTPALTVYQIEALSCARQHGGECLTLMSPMPKRTLRWKCGMGHEWDAPLQAVSLGLWCVECIVLRKANTIVPRLLASPAMLSAPHKSPASPAVGRQGSAKRKDPRRGEKRKRKPEEMSRVVTSFDMGAKMWNMKVFRRPCSRCGKKCDIRAVIKAGRLICNRPGCDSHEPLIE